MGFSRRTFLKRSAAAVALPTFVPAHVLQNNLSQALILARCEQLLEGVRCRKQLRPQDTSLKGSVVCGGRLLTLPVVHGTLSEMMPTAGDLPQAFAGISIDAYFELHGF